MRLLHLHLRCTRGDRLLRERRFEFRHADLATVAKGKSEWLRRNQPQPSSALASAVTRAPAFTAAAVSSALAAAPFAATTPV